MDARHPIRLALLLSSTFAFGATASAQPPPANPPAPYVYRGPSIAPALHPARGTVPIVIAPPPPAGVPIAVTTDVPGLEVTWILSHEEGFLDHHGHYIPVRPGESRFLCVAPCTTHLLRGSTVELIVVPGRLRHRHGTTRSATVVIEDDVLGLHVRFEDRTRVKRRRIAFAVLVPVIGGILTGVSYAVAPLPGADPSGRPRNEALFWAGVTAMVSPVALVFPPLLTRHRTHVTPIRAAGGSDAAVGESGNGDYAED